ncbi:MAG TPA: methionyl-tRNA formyltransferase [Acidiferrobacterales bacterium]|nr:methionyl-tRNA formyltransferase [Acidiferrobacterales bacterium]
MNLVFAGTPEFAVPALKALLDAGHAILAVYTQPDRPAGRGRKLGMSAVKEFALAHGIEVRQPTTLKSEIEAETLRALQPDALIVIAYGLILPKPILSIPRYGCINVHASLLPRWRGAAPIQRAIEAGDTRTGVTIMQMDAGLDTGVMLAATETPVGADDTAATLHDRLADLGGRLLVDTLARLARGDLTPQPQDPAHASYAAKLKKEETRLDWNADAGLLARRVRAFNPWPVAHTTLDGQTLRLWQAQAENGTPAARPPGTVLSADADGVRVQCVTGTLRVTRLQLEGGKVLDARAFLNGRPLPAGTRLGP